MEGLRKRKEQVSEVENKIKQLEQVESSLVEQLGKT